MARAVIIVFEGVQTLDLAGPAEVFSAAGRVRKLPTYDVIIASTTGGELRTSCGLPIRTQSLARIKPHKSDTVVVAGGDGDAVSAAIADARLTRWLLRAASIVRRMCSVCSGAFILASAGLLAGKRATTHWSACERLAKMFPKVEVDKNAIFVTDGHTWTSAGVTTGIDMALALVEEDWSREVADEVAARLVLYMRRPGYQSQFSKVLEIHRLENSIGGKLYAWMIRHLEEDLSIEHLAEHSNMSVRNFARVFQKETGITPAKFVEKVRVEVARRYLEDSDLSIDQIASKCGLGGLISMRRTFIRHMNVSPSDYRRTFRTSLQAIEE